jgi:DnaK suppressor protein
MDAGEQARYRRRLEDLAAEIRRRLADVAETQKPIAPDRAIGRVTRIEALQGQQLALALRDRERQRLQRVEHALSLIRRGEYGVCGKCGQEIARARLDAHPDTFLCMECIEEWQSRGRHGSRRPRRP